MKKKLSLQKKLDSILASEDFEQLENFKDSKTIDSMPPKEREFLGALFLKLGEKLFLNGDNKFLENFEWAKKSAPDSAEIFYKQGLIFSEQENNPRCLTYAIEAFEASAEKNPESFETWLSWGITYTKLGKLHGTSAYYQEGLNKFSRAAELSSNITQNQSANLYWQWGLCWQCLGRFSGEAIDFHSAIEKYRRSVEEGIQIPEFWNNYGIAICELSNLIGRQELLFEAIECYRRAVSIHSKNFDGWCNIGTTFERLFEIHGDNEYFQQSQEAFQIAGNCDESEAFLWLKWGQLYVSYAKINLDIEYLKKAIEKFSKADSCDPGNSIILSAWSEAEMLWGTHLDSVELLRSAEEKIIRSLKINPDNPEIWHVYGMCLMELGRYFSEEVFYYQAIEKFQYGLSLNQSDPLLWYGLALAHYSIGESRYEVPMLEKSARFFSRVLEFGGHNFSQFWNDWGVNLMKLAEITDDKNYLESAIEKYEQAIYPYGEDLSGSIQDIDPEWLYNYGCALDFMGDFTEDVSYYERAVKVLTKTLQLDPNYNHAQYNLALALSHLGETSSDVDILYRALEHFQILLNRDSEDEMGWNDWGLTLLNLAELIHDSIAPHHSNTLYEQAESKFLHAAALGCVNSFYNLACLYSQTENFPFAIHYLEKAEISGGLPSIEDVMHDEWLEKLRSTSLFRNFISNLLSKQQKDLK